ncbi:MAG: hypothetical protein C4321_04575 [Chloroflexota bacterium]
MGAPGEVAPRRTRGLGDHRAAAWVHERHVHCKDYAVILALVAAGLGVAVVPGLAVRDRDVAVRLTQLEPPLVRRISAAFRRERIGHPAVREALEELGHVGRG